MVHYFLSYIAFNSSWCIVSICVPLIYFRVQSLIHGALGRVSLFPYKSIVHPNILNLNLTLGGKMLFESKTLVFCFLFKIVHYISFKFQFALSIQTITKNIDFGEIDFLVNCWLFSQLLTFWSTVDLSQPLISKTISYFLLHSSSPSLCISCFPSIWITYKSLTHISEPWDPNAYTPNHKSKYWSNEHFQTNNITITSLTFINLIQPYIHKNGHFFQLTQVH